MRSLCEIQSQGDNLMFFVIGKEFGCILGFNIDPVVSGRADVDGSSAAHRKSGKHTTT